MYSLIPLPPLPRQMPSARPRREPSLRNPPARSNLGEAEAVRIRGLGGVTYLDNTDANREKRQEGDIVFTAQTDRAYVETTHAVEIADPILRRRIRLAKEDSRTTVVWNPWSTGAQSMADLGDDGWRTMACVEASNIRDFAVDLAPGQQHTMKTVIQVS